MARSDFICSTGTMCIRQKMSEKQSKRAPWPTHQVIANEKYRVVVPLEQ